MNSTKDFHKLDSGVVVNTNTQDYKRARNRNFTRTENDKIIGDQGKVAILETQLAEVTASHEEITSINKDRIDSLESSLADVLSTKEMSDRKNKERISLLESKLSDIAKTQNQQIIDAKKEDVLTALKDENRSLREKMSRRINPESPIVTEKITSLEEKIAQLTEIVNNLIKPVGSKK